MIIPAICCMGYNRPNSIKNLLNSISRAFYPVDNITLIISIDFSDLSDEIKEIAESFVWTHGEKIIISHSERLGLQKHVLYCGDYSIRFGAAIMLEDDVIVAENFYNYVVQCLGYYGVNERHIFGFGLYSEAWNHYASLPISRANNGYDVFWANNDISWGQCFIGNRWKEFKEWFQLHLNKLPAEYDCLPKQVLSWDDKKSWCKYICFYFCENELYYIVPYISLSTNTSQKGTHVWRTDDKSQVPILQGIKSNYHFCNYDNAIRYDAFFERSDPFVKSIKGININHIEIDFYGTKYNYTKPYLLTTKLLPFKVIFSWSLSMEPIESNIIYDNPGEGIFLYQVDLKKAKRNGRVSRYTLLHNCGRYSSLQLLKTFFLKIVSHFKK